MKKVIEVARVNWICFDCLDGIPKGTQYELHHSGKRKQRYCAKCAKTKAS